MWADERQARTLMRQNLPLASTAFLKKVGDFYPSPKASKGDFAHQFDRVNAIISGPPPSLSLTPEWIFNCNTRYITEAYANKTYNYRYSLRPSIHAADLFLTFMEMRFDWRGVRQSLEFPYARMWQSYLVSFIKHGDPNLERKRGTIEWGVAGNDMSIVDLRWEGFQWEFDDQVDAERCAFWQRAEYAPSWSGPNGTYVS